MLMKLTPDQTFEISVHLCSFCQGTYRAFHGFGQAKFPDGGSALGSN